MKMPAAAPIIPKNLPKVKGHPLAIDLAGLLFGRLRAVSYVAGTSRSRWLCECNCGTVLEIDAGNLMCGHSQSCGCLHREKSRITALRLHELKIFGKKPTHGHTVGSKSGSPRTLEYGSWSRMKRRVLNPKNKDYKDYGGRGIKIDIRWMKFENFLADMGFRPTGNHSIDRINNNGNYCKENCRWATPMEQAGNRRSARRFKFQGLNLSIAEWSRRVGIKYSTLQLRIATNGWLGKTTLRPVKPQSLLH